MQIFDHVYGVAAPLLDDDINTDQIAPVSGQLNPDYGYWLFARHRRREDGREIEDFVLNRAQYRSPAILVTGHNFGCGSSREAAVWGLISYGIRCLVGSSFSEIFRENCLQNGVLCAELPEGVMERFVQEVVSVDGRQSFSVDLPSQSISCPGGHVIPFDILPADKMRLLEGLDDIGLTLKHTDAVARWEARMTAEAPWLQQARDRRVSE